MNWVNKILFHDVLFWTISEISGLQVEEILSLDNENIQQIKYNI